MKTACDLYAAPTLIRRDHYGAWRAETLLDLGQNLQLSITTSKKSSGALSTTASVGHVEGNFVSHKVYDDLFITLAAFVVRVTEKNVQAQHAKAIEDSAEQLFGLIQEKYPQLTPVVDPAVAQTIKDIDAAVAAIVPVAYPELAQGVA